MYITVGRAGAAMPEQASSDVQALAVHHRVRGVRMAEVMKPRIRHDTGLAARLAPEVVEFDAGQRPVSFGCRKHPLPRCHFGEAV